MPTSPIHRSSKDHGRKEEGASHQEAKEEWHRATSATVADQAFPESQQRQKCSEQVIESAIVFTQGFIIDEKETDQEGSCDQERRGNAGSRFVILQIATAEKENREKENPRNSQHR